MEFVGRGRQLHRLSRLVDEITASGRGRLLAVRGRRQVGKSRLVTQFVDGAGVPYVYFTAIKNAAVDQQLAAFQADLSQSRHPIPEAETLFAAPAAHWTDLFGRLQLAAQRGPVVVVIDEAPWAIEADSTFEGRLQKAWDTRLQHLPVLLVLIGSDIAMMERLTAHDRPLYGRASEHVVQPFDPAEVMAALGGGSAVTAFDAFLVTGGYPRLVEHFSRHDSAAEFMRAQFSDENSDLIVVAERSLDAEFPPEAQARRVLTAIGSQPVGVATFSSAVAALPESGKAAETALTRALQLLVDTKKVVAVDRPALSSPGTRLKRYRIADPYLRLWFRFVEPQVANIARGRSDIAVAAFDQSWQSWRGLAIEPVVHEALRRLGPSLPAGAIDDVASWWNRDHSVEVDVVASRARTVMSLGSIKWRERRPFSREELAALAAQRGMVPGAGAATLIAVCPAGVRSAAKPDLVLRAADLLAAWDQSPTAAAGD